jgi:putative membrane protein insertion efficiency factor
VTEAEKRDLSREGARPAAAAALAAIGVYKRTLSPAFYALGARCRHLPTCSDYAAEAFARHGAGIGLVLTISRLSRCHPLGSHGWDPTPETVAPAGWRVWRYGDWAWTARPAPASGAASQAVPGD